MVTMEREPAFVYSVRPGLVPLERVAGIERRFPAAWIGHGGHSILPAFSDWAAPLVGPLDRRAWQ